MKLWISGILCTAFMLMISGCNTATPTPKEEAEIDSTLPVIELTKNGIFADTNAIAFEWKNIEDPRVKGVFVYKEMTSPQNENVENSYYNTVKSRFATHYLDTEVAPDTKYTYFFRTFSDNAQSLKSKFIVVNSLPVLQSVSWIHSVEGMPRSAKIIWRPHTNQKVKAYIIERKTLEDEKWNELTTVQGRLSAEYIDLDLKDNFVYKYRIRVITYDGIISTPSEIVKVVTKALPNGVSGIAATKNLPKIIKLNWDKTTQKDFSRYYVYRSNELEGSYELIAKLHNNRFTDEVGEDGKSYFYRVSVVDKDGLESLYKKTSVLGMTLAKPTAPSVVEAKLIGDKIKISWNNTDPRTKSYTIVKVSKKGWFESVTEEIADVPTVTYEDSDIDSDMAYTYIIYAVDSNGIKSKPSIEVNIKTKEVSQKKVLQDTKKDVEVVASPIDNGVSSDEETVIPINDFD